MQCALNLLSQTFHSSFSEVRLNEALENACSNVLDYKVHKDKIKALRYEKSKFLSCHH